MCDCNATGVEAPDCRATTTTRQVCQDEVHISVALNSNDLASALSFEPGTYYLISKSLNTDDCMHLWHIIARTSWIIKILIWKLILYYTKTIDIVNQGYYERKSLRIILEATLVQFKFRPIQRLGSRDNIHATACYTTIQTCMHINCAISTSLMLRVYYQYSWCKIGIALVMLVSDNDSRPFKFHNYSSYATALSCSLLGLTHI